MKKSEKAEGYEIFSQHMEFVGDNVSIDFTDALQQQKEMLMNNKRYDFLGVEQYKAKMFRYSDGSMPPIKVVMGLVGILDVTCKYRPHIKMGDYWLAILPKGKELFRYIFYHRRLNLDNTYSLEYAYHPHISGSGIPCLGAFNTGMTESLISQNIVSFLSNVRSYLEAYNGHSVYQRGKWYAKRHKPFRMIDNAHFIKEYGTAKELDREGIERDNSRWGFPGNLAAKGTSMLVGQERCSFNRAQNGFWNGSRYGNNDIRLSHPVELLDDKVMVEGSDWFNNSARGNTMCEYYQGYIQWIKALLDVTLLQAQDGVNKLFNHLYAQHRGVTDVDEETSMKAVYNEWQTLFYGNKRGYWAVNFGDSLAKTRNRNSTSRITQVYVRVDQKLHDEAEKLWPNLEKKFGGGMNKGKQFCEMIPTPALIGNKMASILKSGTYSKVKYTTFLKGKVQESDAEETLFLADKIRDNVLAAYLEKLQKEEKRCINEWKEIRPDLQPNTTSEPGEQASLFS